MEWHLPRLSVYLPLVILSSTIKSRRIFLLAPAHLGGPGKRAVKWLWWFCNLQGVKDINHPTVLWLLYWRILFEQTFTATFSC